MLKNLIVNVLLVGISAIMALFIVKVFDDWSEDCREARAERRRREEGRRYE